MPEGLSNNKIAVNYKQYCRINWGRETVLSFRPSKGNYFEFKMQLFGFEDDKSQIFLDPLSK